MTDRSVQHATFTIERTYPAAPERVFNAFAKLESKKRWFAHPEGWDTRHELDFRVGGREHASGGPKGGTRHVYDATFQDIVPGERIVTTYTMHMDATLTSISVATLELRPAGDGTRLVLTEQGAFLDGWDNGAQREEGTEQLLAALGRALERGDI